MDRDLGDRTLAELMDGLDGALDAVSAHGLVPVDARDAYEVVRRLERIGRRVQGLQVGLVAEIDRRHLHRADGHRTARAMVAFAARLSPAEAGRRSRAARALRDLPAVAAKLASGAIGRDQVDRIARVHANRRVRAELLKVDADLAVVAARVPYRDLDAHLTAWERLTDEDGAADRAERDHQRRDFAIRRNLDGSYRFEGGCGAMQGTVAAEVFDAYVRAEFEADWAEARDRLGAETTLDDLARTDAQRRMDAVERIFFDAAANLADRSGHQIVTNLVIDLPTFERHAARLAGLEPTDPDPRLGTFWSALAGSDGEEAPDPESGADHPPVDRARPDPIGHRCSTRDGAPLDPTEAVAVALCHQIRRVVVGADGVVVDMGRLARLFTGPRHLAVTLQATTCYWPGCEAPTSQCQADHLQPWSSGGSTRPGNGAPACGKHNRFRSHGFTVRRDGDGKLHVHRPDGTEIM